MGPAPQLKKCLICLAFQSFLTFCDIPTNGPRHHTLGKGGFVSIVRRFIFLGVTQVLQKIQGHHFPSHRLCILREGGRKLSTNFRDTLALHFFVHRLSFGYFSFLYLASVSPNSHAPTTDTIGHLWTIRSPRHSSPSWQITSPRRQGILPRPVQWCWVDDRPKNSHVYPPLSRMVVSSSMFRGVPSRLFYTFFSFFFHAHIFSGPWTSRGNWCRRFFPPVLAFIFFRA